MKIAKYISFIITLISLLWLCNQFDFEPLISFLLSIVALIGFEIKTNINTNASKDILNELSKFNDLKIKLLNNYYRPDKEMVDNFDELYSKLITEIISNHPKLEDEFKQLANYILPSKKMKKGGIEIDRKKGIEEFQKNYKLFIRKIK